MKPLKRIFKHLIHPRNFKELMFSVLMLWATAVIVFCGIETAVMRNRELEHDKYVLGKCQSITNSIESLDKSTMSLERKYHENIIKIYGRIVEINMDSSDEVMNTVISNTPDSGDDDNPIKFEAYVLALLQNYDILQSDTQIQVFLNDNADIITRINENNELRSKLIDVLDEYTVDEEESSELTDVES